MKEHSDFKYQKLLWSIVIVFALCLYIARSVHQTDSIFGAYGFFILAYPLFCSLGLILLLLRLVRLAIRRHSFIYIFTATALMAVASYSIYLLFIASVSISLFQFWLLLAPLLLATYMNIDIFISESPNLCRILKKRTLMKKMSVFPIGIFLFTLHAKAQNPVGETKDWKIYKIKGHGAFQYTADTLKNFKSYALTIDSINFYLNKAVLLSPKAPVVWMGGYVVSFIQNGRLKKAEVSIYGGYIYIDSNSSYYEIPDDLKQDWLSFFRNAYMQLLN